MSEIKRLESQIANCRLRINSNNQMIEFYTKTGQEENVKQRKQEARGIYIRIRELQEDLNFEKGRGRTFKVKPKEYTNSLVIPYEESYKNDNLANGIY